MEFHPLWKDATLAIPLLNEVKAVYAKLQLPSRLGESSPF